MVWSWSPGVRIMPIRQLRSQAAQLARFLDSSPTTCNRIVPSPNDRCMKILRTTPERIELGGMPAAGFAMLGGVFVCPVLALGVVFFLWKEWTSRGAHWYSPQVLILFGTTAFVAFLWAVCFSMFLRREWLVMDKVTGRGEHGTRWIWGTTAGRIKSFELDRIRHVALEYYMSSGGGRRGSVPREQKRARLLLDKPRRAIVLEDSEGGIDGRVEPVARDVAEWLGVEVRVMGERE